MSNTKAKGNGRWTPVNRTPRQELRRWRRWAFRAKAPAGTLSSIRYFSWGHGQGFRGPGGR